MSHFLALKAEYERYRALMMALSLMSFDSDTYAAKNSFNKTMNAMATIGQEAFSILTGEKLQGLVDTCLNEDISEFERSYVLRLKQQLDKQKVIPADEHHAYDVLSRKANLAWEEAKNNNDYASFAPYLKELIAFQKKFASYRQKEGQPLYDVVLDDYEPGMNMEIYDRFFNTVKEGIVPLIHEVAALNQPKPEFLSRHYDIAKQREFNEWLAGYIGFDLTRGKIAETEHPYTTNLHNEDVRFTNHFYEDALDSAIFSTVHEGGHGLYEQHISDTYAYTPFDDISSGMHESQSRFMENYIGRSLDFWKPIYAKLVSYFPEQLSDVNVEQFVEGINDARPSLVRIEADELTYALHIVIRYELEREIFAGDIDVKDLPRLWNEKYEAYLGVTPPNDTLGILQDVHWSGGSFGYFPTYALGSAIAAQIFAYLKKNKPLSAWMQEEGLPSLNAWLEENIHQYAGFKKTDEILLEATGEVFNPQYYVDYLNEKYRALYHLN